MKHSTIIIDVLTFLYPGRNVTSKVENGNQLKVQYNSVAIGGYEFKLVLANNGISKAKFGCQTVSLTTVQKAIAFLEGKTSIGQRKRLVKKEHADNKFIKQIVVEESESFFITDKKKVYPKSEYDLRLVDIPNDALKYADRWGYKLRKGTTPTSSHYIFFSGGGNNRELCTNNTKSKNVLLANLKYIESIMVGVKEFVKSNPK